MKKVFISGIITVSMLFGGYTTVFASTLPARLMTTTRTVTTTTTTTKDIVYTSISSEGVVNSPVGLYMLSEANLDGTIITALDYGTKVTIDGVSGEWYKVTADGFTGYVYKEYITTNKTSYSTSSTSSTSTTSSTTTTTRYGIVSNLNSGYTLDFRTAPNTSSEVIGSLSNGTAVNILGETNGWYYIEYNGETGYVYGEFITLTNSPTSSSSTSSSSSSSPLIITNVTANQLINYAKQFEGYPYVWGGNTPSTGFDCSGFVQYIFNHFGISLPRTTYTQVNCGTAVSLSDIEPGDLVFEIPTAKGPSHVGIYIGDGKILNAMDPANGVTISPLYQVVAVRRIL